MITVRQAATKDVFAIRDIFLACYGTDYSPRYYDENQLTRLVYSDDSLLLVAEDTESGEIAGTASVELEVSARSDLGGRVRSSRRSPRISSPRRRKSAHVRAAPPRPGPHSTRLHRDSHDPPLRLADR